ncbi:hypothetical protein G7078_03620 [Sphingomonas sinipercae]|uniref:Peptidase metallopeptidase domain-containing protein n=1 Tax=Sphingomonas sinipercae TaxID=2714944 RepID=A0A6G7ZM09_9SPHN|nr:FG-GAP-like repeat-containing protein [Sphingomonas sinipercae]QIL01965.1 hypothetical protein G7078_03620 [Sphingomonas sinipercae]
MYRQHNNVRDVDFIRDDAFAPAWSGLNRGDTSLVGDDYIQSLRDGPSHADQIPGLAEVVSGSAQTTFNVATFRIANFGTSVGAGQWSNNNVYSRQLADVNGDGMADIIGFGNAGVYVALATGGGNFGTANFVIANFGAAASGGGWTSMDAFPRRLADINGDGRADIVGFGNAGVYVSLANASGGFANATLVMNAFGAAPSSGGWGSDNIFHRELADVNGDGRADIVGFGASGVWVALGTTTGTFTAPTLTLGAFGYGPEAGGWASQETFARMLGDVNGDGMADLIGFGENGVNVALAIGGGAFGFPSITLNEFGAGSGAGGWSSYDTTPRMLADVNGDGMDDVVGFDETGVYVAFATGGGNFTASQLLISEYGATAGGWNSLNTFPRTLGDVNGDGRADIVGFGIAGTYVSLSSVVTPPPPPPASVYTIQETTGQNGSIYLPQVLDRTLFTVSNDPNLETSSDPSARIVGSLTPGDQDYFSITLQAGELLILDVDNTTGGIDTVVTIVSPLGEDLATNDDGTTPDGVLDAGSVTYLDSLMEYRAPTSGTYYFRIEGYNGAGTGNYNLNVSIGPIATPEQIHEENIEALIWGYTWNTVNLTYSFPTSVSQYASDGDDEIGTFQVLLPVQQDATRTILQYIASLTNLTFTENSSSPGSAMLRYARSDTPETAYAYSPGSGNGGDSWYNASNGKYDNPVVGNYAWATFIHETGHALGLKHGHESPALDPTHDSLEYSIMTYRSFIGGTVGGGYSNEQWGFPTTFMMYDIAALQRLYGADFGTNSGNTTYSWNANTGAFMINGAVQATPGGNRVFMTIWDGGGVDTYDFSNYTGDASQRMNIDLRPGEESLFSIVQRANLGGTYASGNVYNALQYNGDVRSLIENVIGTSGNDNITGNNVANVLRGNGGNDDYYFYTVDQSKVGAADTILDFNSGDRLNFSAIDANTNTTANDAFTFLGTGAFTGQAGQLRYAQIGSDVHLYADVNGDGVADMEVILLGKTGILPPDLIL